MADIELLQGFIIESLDLLDNVEPTLIQLQGAGAGVANPDLINTIFRTFHSVKGGAGMLEDQRNAERPLSRNTHG